MMSQSTAVARQSFTNSPASPVDVLIGLFKCYNFLTNNEYSDKTLGTLAFLLRKAVGDINFSDIFTEYEKRCQQELRVDFVTLLKERRQRLKNIDASIEPCLMLNRMITHIQADPTHFMSIISDIQEDMKRRMTDDQQDQKTNYPNDFRQREKDFHKRRQAQNMRRLFYLTPTEAQAPSLIHLQNRTTEHLSYLIDCKMRYEQNFRETGPQELINILSTSFMVIAQPHAGVNPVLVYERKGPGLYTAKVSVTIVSLLHDFMESHPNMIKLDDIVPILHPSSDLYELSEPRKLSWETCELHINPNEKPRIIQYAKLSSIIIKESSSTTESIHFSDKLSSFNFPITLRLNLTEHHISKTYQIPLESLPFVIVSNTSRISRFLTTVIIDDIRRSLQSTPNDIKKISDYLLRYFIRRTGVSPAQDLKIYLDAELTKAEKEKKNCQSLEDIFMGFLVPFVHQVEFMAKHPILAMFYADGLFLGSCNSALAVTVMEKLATVNLPIVLLRFTSIKTKNPVIASKATSSKVAQIDPCYVRIIIYNARTKSPQNLTFDSSTLAIDICKFVSTANAEKASYIRILSHFGDKTNSQTYKCYTDFTQYHHDRLHEILRTDADYTDITNLFADIKDYGSNHHVNGNQNTNSSQITQTNSYPILPVLAVTTNHGYGSNGTTVPLRQPNPNETSLQNVLYSSNPQPLPLFNDQDVVRHVLSHPSILKELVCQIRNLRLSSATVPVLQQQPCTSTNQTLNTNSQILPNYQQQSSPLIPFQMSHPLQQEQPSPCTRFAEETYSNVYQQFPVFANNDIQSPSNQHLTQTSENDLGQSMVNADIMMTDQPPNEDDQSYDDEDFFERLIN